VAVNALLGYKRSFIPMLSYAGCLWGIDLGSGVLLGLTDRLGPACGASGFWLAGALVALYLDRVSQASLNDAEVEK
jgi:MATE family multidrug resistance protein